MRMFMDSSYDRIMERFPSPSSLATEWYALAWSLDLTKYPPRYCDNQLLHGGDYRTPDTAGARTPTKPIR